MTPTSQSPAAGAFRPGDCLTSPGKHLVFVSLTPDALTFHETVAVDAPAVPLHLHMAQSERFTVLDGILTVTVAGTSTRLVSGETVLLPAGTPHSYANGGKGPMRIAVTLTPAQGATAFFAGIYGMQRDNRLPPRGLRDALALADLCHRHGFYLAAMPLILQRPLMAVGAGLARLLGATAPTRIEAPRLLPPKAHDLPPDTSSHAARFTS